MNKKIEISQSCRALGIYPGKVTFAVFHPSTDPEAIAHEQRRVIRAAMQAVGRDPEKLSDAVDLPVSIIRVRLDQINKIRRKKVAV